MVTKAATEWSGLRVAEGREQRLKYLSHDLAVRTVVWVCAGETMLAARQYRP